MPTGAKQKQTQKRPFLYGMVIGEFVAFRTYGTEIEVRDLLREIETFVGEDNAISSHIVQFAECFIYTQDCTFDWHEDTPDELRSFEKFWDMVKEGVPPVECWQYFAENIANYLLTMRSGSDKGAKQVKNPLSHEIGWHAALYKALFRWAPPPEWKMEEELTEAERADPN